MTEGAATVQVRRAGSTGHREEMRESRSQEKQQQKSLPGSPVSKPPPPQHFPINLVWCPPSGKPSFPLPTTTAAAARLEGSSPTGGEEKMRNQARCLQRRQQVEGGGGHQHGGGR